jgi:ABC-type lipoprotein export system ATPase subunit
MSMDLITVESVGVFFDTPKGGRMSVLTDVSASFQPERISVVLGASGSGKSTLMHVMGGFLRPVTGKVWISGESLWEMAEYQRAQLIRSHIGFVFQDFHLIPSVSVRDNLALPLVFLETRERLSLSGQADVEARILGMLARMGMGHKADALPSQLSGGEKQRVAIARALIAGPKIVICDEPTGNLDDGNTDIFKELISSIAYSEGVTVVIVTHDHRLVSIADTVMTIVDGRLTTGG